MVRGPDLSQSQVKSKFIYLALFITGVVTKQLYTKIRARALMGKPVETANAKTTAMIILIIHRSELLNKYEHSKCPYVLVLEWSLYFYFIYTVLKICGSRMFTSVFSAQGLNHFPRPRPAALSCATETQVC